MRRIVNGLAIAGGRDMTRDPPVSSWRTRSSSTLRSSTTGNDVTRHSGCSARSSSSSVTPTTWPAFKQADGAKPGAHESLHESRGASGCVCEATCTNPPEHLTPPEQATQLGINTGTEPEHPQRPRCLRRSWPFRCTGEQRRYRPCHFQPRYPGPGTRTPALFRVGAARASLPFGQSAAPTPHEPFRPHSGLRRIEASSLRVHSAGDSGRIDRSSFAADLAVSASAAPPGARSRSTACSWLAIRTRCAARFARCSGNCFDHRINSR